MQRWRFSSCLLELKHSKQHIPQLPPQEVASSGGGRPGALQDSLVHKAQGMELKTWNKSFIQSLHFLIDVNV